MTTINDIFCTPEQGRRLAELVPELTSAFVWYVTPNMKKLQQNRSNGCPIGAQNYHALTLQELRDVAKDIRIRTTNDYWVYTQKVFNATAPELAAWMIERLEEVKR